MSASDSVPGPAQVDATLQRLMLNPNVHGVLVLSRPQGIIIKSAGLMFSQSTRANEKHQRLSTQSDSVSDVNEQDEQHGEHDDLEEARLNVHNDLAIRYAERSIRLVDAVTEDVKDLDQQPDGQQDDVRFLRIRTIRHELIITPDEHYILVVIQGVTA
ncbi:hypothetical protein OIO90_005882 [Microbotryomycetes sp. JL221]|nr:hypothetical protein OIO90_005882 [Microbotryomycetes sp. JL221]